MKTFHRDDNGANAVEFAVAFPAYIAVIVMILKFGELLWAMNTVNYAVNEAARCGAVDTVNCGTTAQIQAFGASRGMNLVPAAQFAVTKNPVCVTAAYTPQIIPLNFSFRACHA